MKPVPPHHLLSAYLDGELSPSEREQVEHLLEASESARRELRELEQIGELLRQLPRESLPKTFASDLLDRCLSETRISEAETQTLKIPVSDASAASNRKRRWLGLAIVGISATALGWLSIVFWPSASPTSPNEVASNSPDETEADASAFEDSRGPMPMAAGDAAPRIVLNEARSQLAGQDSERKIEQRPFAAEMSQTMRALAGAAASQPLRLEMDNLKEAPVDRVVEALDQPDEQVAVVKLQVGNRREALKELQTLLNQHQIALAPVKDRQTEAEDANAAKDSPIVAVYVDASDDRLAAAIRDLQQKASFQKATIEAPIALAGLDLLMSSREDGLSAPPRSRMMKLGEAGSRFGGVRMRSQKAGRDGQTPKPAAITAPSAEKTPSPEKAPAESAPAPAKSLADAPEPPPSPAGNVPAPTSDPSSKKPSADSDQETSEADKPGQTKAKPGDEKPAAQAAPKPTPSTQREVTLSAPLLSALQKQVKASAAFKKEAMEEKAAASGKRVQVLFILVDQASAGEPVPTN